MCALCCSCNTLTQCTRTREVSYTMSLYAKAIAQGETHRWWQPTRAQHWCPSSHDSVGDTLSLDCQSPAIKLGDNSHRRGMIINARRKRVDLINVFGTSFLQSVRTCVQNFSKRDKTETWTFVKWTKRLHLDCGIWAICIQEKWMQYCGQTEATTTPVNWLEQDGDMIPEGQDLRQHYHVVVQIASATGEDGNTELGKSRKISTSRKANHGDRQAIYDRYKMRRRSDSYAGTFQSGSTGGKGSIPGKQTTACNSQAPLHKSHRYNIQKCHPPDTTTWRFRD